MSLVLAVASIVVLVWLRKSPAGPMGVLDAYLASRESFRFNSTKPPRNEADVMLRYMNDDIATRRSWSLAEADELVAIAKRLDDVPLEFVNDDAKWRDLPPEQSGRILTATYAIGLMSDRIAGDPTLPQDVQDRLISTVINQFDHPNWYARYCVVIFAYEARLLDRPDIRQLVEMMQSDRRADVAQMARLKLEHWAQDKARAALRDAQR